VYTDDGEYLGVYKNGGGCVSSDLLAEASDRGRKRWEMITKRGKDKEI